MSARPAFVSAGLDYLGEVVLMGDLDCSDLVARAFKKAGGPDWTKTHTAQRLHDEATRALVAGEEPLIGDLVFHGYTVNAGRPQVVHVGIWLAGGKVLSADGATKSITTHAAAAANPRCRVHVHDSILYRKDLPYLAVRRFTALDTIEQVTR